MFKAKLLKPKIQQLSRNKIFITPIKKQFFTLPPKKKKTEVGGFTLSDYPGDENLDNELEPQIAEMIRLEERRNRDGYYDKNFNWNLKNWTEDRINDYMRRYGFDLDKNDRDNARFMEQLFEMLGPKDEEEFKKGGSIHIKEKNKGKFTDYCDGKVTQDCINKAKKSGNKKLIKRAVFAENARKWKH